MTVELLGVGIASCHHRCTLGDAQIGLPQPNPVPRSQAVQAPDRPMQQFGVGWEADGLGLHRGVDRDPGEVLAAQCAGVVCHPQALGQQQLQLVTEPLAPVTEVGALVWEGVLEELLASEELEMSLGALMRLTSTICSPVCGGLFFHKQPIGKTVETYLRTM